MSTQTKSGGGGRKSNKTANSNTTHADNTNKKVISDHNKTEKEKPQIKVSIYPLGSSQKKNQLPNQTQNLYIFFSCNSLQPNKFV